MWSSQVNEQFSWKASEENPSERRMLHVNYSIVTSIRQTSTCWLASRKMELPQIMTFSDIMSATRYGDIPSTSLISFIRAVYPTGHRLFQDNHPKHASRYIQDFSRRMESTGGKPQQRAQT